MLRRTCLTILKRTLCLSSQFDSKSTAKNVKCCHEIWLIFSIFNTKKIFYDELKWSIDLYMVMEVWIDCVIAWQKALITSKEKWLSRLIKELWKTLASKCIQIIKMFKCTRDDVCGCRIFMVPVCTIYYFVVSVTWMMILVQIVILTDANLEELQMKFSCIYLLNNQISTCCQLIF